MTRVALLMGDHADARCGVGRSLAALVECTEVTGAATEVEVLDLATGHLWPWWRRCRRAAARCDGAVLVYPTRSTFERPGAFARALVARAAFRGRWFRPYLHEYRRFRRPHRPFVAVLAALATDRTIVSTRAEAAALERGRARRLAARRPVLVAPPANGAAPAGTAPPASDAARRQRTVGIFGMLRPDKGVEWAVDVLSRLDGVDRLELAGDGWDPTALPGHVRDRYEIEVLGHVPDEQVASVLAGWRAALAPFADGPHDGRLSLRTPLAHGVPTLTPPPRPGELTLRPPHLLVLARHGLPVELPEPDDDARRAGAQVVATFEADSRRRLVEALFGSGAP